MAKKGNDYFGLGRLVSIILAIIPVTSLVCGVLTRFQEKKYVAAILRIVLGWNLIWILDIIFMVMKNRIFRILNV